MQSRPGDGRWPHLDFGDAFETLVDEDDELVMDGLDTKSGARVVVSMRDLGDEVSAGFWDEELARLVHVRHPCAARVLDARIEDDRFFVVTTKAPVDGVALKHRLALGPLDGAEAVSLALATLEVAVELHALGLSAAGMRLRAAMIVDADAPGQASSYVLTTYGLHVDNDVEVFNDLREIGLRVLGLIGGRHERGALILPAGVLDARVEALFRRAIGLARPELTSAREMLEELAELTGHRRRRAQERTKVTTRPIAQAATMYGSDLLLAEEFLAEQALDEANDVSEDSS